jgi:osmotically-inducible protein OsmY
MKRLAVGLVMIGGVAMLGERATTHTSMHATMRHSLHPLARRVRGMGGRLRGRIYRLRKCRPDPDVTDPVLADRIRSTLGPLEKRLDLPHIHVMVHDHIALLHGDVGSYREVDEIDTAVAAVSGVAGVDSWLHVGLIAGDTRPSTGRAVVQPSDALTRS